MSTPDTPRRSSTDDSMTLTKLQRKYEDELQKVADSDLPAAWVAEALLDDEDGDVDA